MTSLALDNIEPVVISVKKESPFKTLKDVVDAAKANPQKVKSLVDMYENR